MARLILKQGLLLAAAISSVVARSPTPRFPYDPDTTPHCSWWHNHDGTQTCQQILDSGWITIDEFRRWNPSIGADCDGIEPERSYCIEAFDEPEPPTTTSTTTTSPPGTTTAPGNGVTTPQPTQGGMVSDCARFYFVEVGDSCADIASDHGISLEQFVTWNPSVQSTCTGLWAEVNVCVGLIGMTSTQPPPTTTTTAPGNGVTTPLPIQPDMVDNCNRFYFVNAGDSCAIIASDHGISLAQFVNWNPSVGSTCAGLWAEVNVCVGVIGQSPPTITTSTTTTTAGNGITTPVPTQPGMVSNCDRFQLVSSGDSCASLGADNGVRSERIRAWNTGVGNLCSGLWANAYACVRTIGFTPSVATTCSSNSNDKLWGGNLPAAQSSFASWCNGGGSGNFAVAQRKTGCYNAPNGQNRIELVTSNQFGAAASLSGAKCRELLGRAVNNCNRGGWGTEEGWSFSAYVRGGRC